MKAWNNHKNAMIVLCHAYDGEVMVSPHLAESQTEDTIYERWWKSLAIGCISMVPEENKGESQ
jgi:hypothetical protein